jgi:hypothetical protein
MTEIFASPAQKTQCLSHQQMAQIEKCDAQDPEKNHHKSRKNDFTDKKDQAEKYQHRQAGTPEQIGSLAPVRRNPARPIQIQGQKNSSVDHQQQ